MGEVQERRSEPEEGQGRGRGRGQGEAPGGGNGGRFHPAYFGMYLALALILSYVETLIPFYVGIPGVKLGLTNLVIVLMLYDRGASQALVLSCARVLLAGFLFGNLSSILYSMAGGVLSLLCMAGARRTGKFSVYGVSMVGGVTHNIGQILVAMAVVESVGIAFYLPVLLVSGVVTGALIGVAAAEVRKRLPRA